MVLLAVIAVGSVFFVRLGDGPARRADRPTVAPSTRSTTSSAPASTAASRSTPPAPPPVPAPPAVLAVDGGGGPIPAAAGVGRALGRLLAAPALGGVVAARITDLSTGQVLLDRNPSHVAPPASTAKILTALAAMQVLAPDLRLTTTVVAGATPGQVVLVGGGDPTLSAAGRGVAPSYAGAARIRDLAAAVRRAGVGRVTFVLVDGSRFTGPQLGAGWDPDDVSGAYAAPITARTVDGGRERAGYKARSAAPDLHAGAALAGALGSPSAAVSRGPAPAHARVLARVQSAPVSQIIAQMLSVSDNVLAEYLIRQVAITTGAPASFAGATGAVHRIAVGLGVPGAGMSLVDGSGLSRSDRLSPGALTAALRIAAAGAHPRLHALLGDLPVGGWSGTLSTRYRSPSTAPGAGRVRAKTGTLTGVSSLAGIVADADGRLLTFAVMADQVPATGTLDAEAALDRIAATLAGCGCR
ncbi:MAG: D-alanyl-D-alanine carboxypeptidase/D-alanyl-D-alanine endopeptidase [Mycobacteriales bacterium]